MQEESPFELPPSEQQDIEASKDALPYVPDSTSGDIPSIQPAPDDEARPVPPGLEIPPSEADDEIANREARLQHYDPDPSDGVDRPAIDPAPTEEEDFPFRSDQDNS